MCNIIMVKSNNKDVVLKYAKYLNVRGRDAYTLLINDTLYRSTKLQDILIYIEDYDKDIKHVIMHARAIPETEKVDTNRNFIYTNGRLYIAHHGLIPDAEKYNSNIDIDSELLLDIYQTFDYDNPDKWFVDSLKSYPRATTEIVYDSNTDKFIVATNFMPLYKYCSGNTIAYSTYKINDNFYNTYPYTIEVV